ncbi:hypothetical protein ACE1AT_19580 [Pelatocladus sp. BLCC-F211]|uniref:hypothetical protein n=1 Tax=Pelatocladus sp. BLCC-F211 TaxID=3342752 RepID=UPI0035B8D9FE
MPDYPDEYLELLIFYQQEIEEIIQQLNSIPGLPYSLITKVTNLQFRINWDIQNQIDRGQIPAPTDPIDF